MLFLPLNAQVAGNQRRKNIGHLLLNIRKGSLFNMKRTELIFGSTALKFHFPDLPREPHDLDVISKSGKMEQKEQHYWVDSFQYILDNNKDDIYIDPNLLLSCKLSHLGWNVHWSKTLNDVLFLKKKGCKVVPELYKLLVKDWTKVHGKAWASLENKDAGKFFKDAVKRKYVHDDLHEVVSVYEEPLYFRILKEDGKVGCSEEKFNQLSHEDKILLVKEEVWVTALERYLIPNNFKCSKNLAYFESLKKLSTTMASGWFKFFILDNIDQLYISRDYAYIDKFKQAEKLGKIRLENN